MRVCYEVIVSKGRDEKTNWDCWSFLEVKWI